MHPAIRLIYEKQQKCIFRILIFFMFNVLFIKRFLRCSCECTAATAAIKICPNQLKSNFYQRQSPKGMLGQINVDPLNAIAIVEYF